MGLRLNSRLVAACIAAIFGMSAVTQAVAASRLCLQLESELVAASRGTRSTAQVRRYDRALEAQERQLAISEQQWSRAGCGYSRRNDPGSVCMSIEATLARMERNYDKLLRDRAELGDATNSQAERMRLEAAIEDARCREDEQAASAVIQPALPEKAGRYRTICVRACDGYFFPMSFGVSEREFARDTGTCQAACPGTDMRLYVHRVPGEEAADMVSAASGEPYAALETANLYRQPDGQPATCGCGQKGAPMTTASPSPSILVLPDASAEPSKQVAVETAAPTLRPEPQTPPVIAPEAPARELTDADRSVRTVGPKFLPDQEEAIDLRAPGRKTAP